MTRALSLPLVATPLTGNKTAPIAGVLPRRLAHPSCSFERGHTHNQCGYSSERNEVGVINHADQVVGLLGRHSLPRNSSSNLRLTIRDWHEEFRECPTSCRSTNVLKMRKNP